jgi:hypothetical protein
MQGNLGPFLAAFPGNPQGVGTTIFDCVPGTIVIDTQSGGSYRKVSPAGDNSEYVPIGVTKAFSEDFSGTDTADQVSVILPSGLAASGATGAVHHVYTPDGNVFGWAPLGAGQTLLPTIVASGLDIGGDQTSTEGAELFSNFLGATGRPFIVGSDPAFFFQAKLTIADVSGITSMCVGFRRAQVNVAALATYLDYAGIGITTGSAATTAPLKMISSNDDVEPSAVDTGAVITDVTALTVRVNVSAAGVVTLLTDAAVPGTLAAPATGATVVLAIDDGDPVIPFIFFIQGADLADSVIIQNWAVGFQ